MELEDRYQMDIEELKINLLSESERILVYIIINIYLVKTINRIS